jgi:hypothetical protein
MLRIAAFLIAGWLTCCIAISPAYAHSQSSSQMTLKTENGVPRALAVDVSLIDLLHWVDLDGDDDARVVWGEVLDAKHAILAFIADNVQVSAGIKPCRLAAREGALSMLSRDAAPSLRVALRVHCPRATEAEGFRLHYDLFFDGDPMHRALLRVTGEAGDSVHLLTADSRELRLAGISRFSGSTGFVGEGFRHILSGYDHLLFLLLLILPAAGAKGVRARLLRIGAIVTAFTVAHSITLAAAMTDALHLPAKPVEIAIAASIVVAALLNVARPGGHALGWKIAFAFGLLHGFGFAGALAELSLDPNDLWATLLAFNIGIELGQLAIVALVLPALALISLSPGYQSRIVPSASLACAALGVMWTAARL